MKDGKLIRLLAKLDELELKPLMRFVKSPYHNSNKLIIQLLQKLLTYYPGFDHKKITKEHLYHHIHPEGKSYHEGRMNLLMTNLVSVVQEFFMYQEFQKDKLLQKKLKGKAYSNRNMYKNYKKEVEGMLVDLESSPYREEDYFFQKYDILQEFFFHIETPTGYIGSTFLFDSMDSLDKFYMTAKLTLAAEQITMTKKLNTSREVRFLNNILSCIENENEFPNVLKIYSKFINLRKSGHNELGYDEVKNGLFENTNSIEMLKQKLIYYNLLNHSINELNQGREEFLKEIFTLHKFGLEQNYIIDNGRITSSSFSSIIIVSARLKEFEWGKNFIQKYETFLNKEEAYLTKLMGLAFWHYRKGLEGGNNNFYKTLELLREVKYSKKNIFLFIRSRNLWIQSAYEIFKFNESYYSTIVDYIKNYENQLRKDNILSKEIIQRYFNFIFYIKNLLKLSLDTKDKSKKIDVLLKELDSGKVTMAKKWIKEKLEELL